MVAMVAVVAWIAASVPWPVSSDRVRGVHIGMTESQVVEVMGRPHYQGKPSKSERYYWTWERWPMHVVVVYFSPEGNVVEAFND